MQVTNYTPKLNDYVKWHKGKHSIEGWVYFKDKEYITIETKVWPKHPEDRPQGTFHRNERTLVVCYPHDWKDLQYVQSRPSIDSEEYYVKDDYDAK